MTQEGYINMLEILPVTPDDLLEITKLAAECWKDYFAGVSDSLLQAACGMIVRNNYIEPELSFKIINDGKIVAVVFAGTAVSMSHPEDFYEHQLSILKEDQREWLMTQRAYHKKADKECKKLLDSNTFKLALFMSDSKGCGRVLLNYVTDILRNKGFKRMALWTDTSCSFDYYSSHGFNEQSSIFIPEYSSEQEEYRLFTFTKEI